MPANRTSGTLLLQLTECRIECESLRLEVEMLKEQLRRHPSGELQIREVRRMLQARQGGSECFPAPPYLDQ